MNDRAYTLRKLDGVGLFHSTKNEKLQSKHERSFWMAEKSIASKVPQHQIDALARCLLPAMIEYFESEEGKRELREWKAAKAEHEGLRKPKEKVR